MDHAFSCRVKKEETEEVETQLQLAMRSIKPPQSRGSDEVYEFLFALRRSFVKNAGVQFLFDSILFLNLFQFHIHCNTTLQPSVLYLIVFLVMFEKQLIVTCLYFFML